MAEKDQEFFKIQTEWMRYKNCLYDKNTSLPSFIIGVEQVRKLLDDQKILGLIYVSIFEQGKLESIYGWQIFDEIIKYIAQVLKIVRDNYLTSEDLITVLNVKSGEFLIFVSKDKSGNVVNIEFLDWLINVIQNEIREILSDFNISFIEPTVNLRIGYSILTQSPIARIERIVYNAVDEAKLMATSRIQVEEIKLKSELNKIITEKRIRTFYQPIIDLQTLEIFGYEALSRGPTDSIFQDPELLFEFARKVNMTTELERLCREKSIINSTSIPNRYKLFINTEVQAIPDPEFREEKLGVLLESAGVDPKNIVLEITERSAIRNYEMFKNSLKFLRKMNFSIAIDDAGTGHASLQTITELAPDYIKFDMSLVKDIDKNLIKRNLLSTLTSFSKQINFIIIAEGIETKGEYQVLKDMGINFGQGFFFAKPSFPAVSEITVEI
ncbi:MAG: EAL domain-containing protein [bacterium]|nr:EAL domain-containing protein [bacterium]